MNHTTASLVGMDTESRDYRRLTCEIAFSFGIRIRNVVGEDAYWSIVEENAKRTDRSCATHDHCDANEVMLEAMALHGLVQPDAEDFDDEVDCGAFANLDEAYGRMWHKAWNYWKAHSTACMVDPGFKVK